MDQDNNQKDPQANADPAMPEQQPTATPEAPAQPETVAEPQAQPETQPQDTPPAAPMDANTSAPGAVPAPESPQDIQNPEPVQAAAAEPEPAAMPTEPQATQMQEEPVQAAPAVEDSAQAASTEEAPAPAAAPVETPQAEASSDCGCPTINAAEWDKQQKQIDKTFYTTFSPRLMFMPFSFAIDLDRARKGAEKAGYTVPQHPMIMDTGGMFWSTLMVEVDGAEPGAKNTVSLAGKNLYSKVSIRPWKDLKDDVKELEAELGKKPKNLYFWWTSCPKCNDHKEVKTVLIAEA